MSNHVSVSVFRVRDDDFATASIPEFILSLFSMSFSPSPHHPISPSVSVLHLLITRSPHLSLSSISPSPYLPISLPEIVIQHVHPAVFDHVDARELHHLPDLRLIVAMVALGLTLLAHGFGIVGAFQSHRQTVGEKPGAFLAHRNLGLFKLLDIHFLKGKRGFFSFMMFPAIDGNKF